MQVTNHSRSPLGIPGYGMLEVGASGDIPDKTADNPIVAAWLKRGMLALNADVSTDHGAVEATVLSDVSNMQVNGGDERARLVEQLVNAGEKKPGPNTKLETLRKRVADLDEAE